MKSPLRLILRATRCHSTHHCFALDALPMVQTEAGERLVQLLLVHHNRYLTGAIDPDIRYRDFQNHVVHVTDGFWGGAPRVAHLWYDRLQRYLRSDRFSDAAHAAGVLSHYFTDPFQPLHTQHCQREAVLHRPIEASIRHSYTRILKDWKRDEMRVVFQLSDRPGWLGEAILHGARFANRRYTSVLDGFDLLRGMEDPAAGLNSAARMSLSELFGLALTGWARVLERAAADAEAARGSALPQRGLFIPTLFATIQSPLRWWMVRTEYKLERHAVEQLVDEFRRLGKLKEHIPAEVDIVDRVIQVYNDEKRWKKQRELRRATDSMPLPAMDQRPATVPFPSPTEKDSERRGLALSDPMIASPLIGPATASSFQAIGIDRIEDFIAGDASDMAKRIGAHWVTPNTVRRWQSQTQLICDVPELAADDARLLTGAGYASAAEIGACQPETLHRRISDFAHSREARSELHDVSPPSLAQVHSWVERAKRKLAADDSPLRRSA